MRAAPFVGLVLALTFEARAAAPNVLLELVDAEPIGVKITAAEVTQYKKGNARCDDTSQKVLFSGMLVKGQKVGLEAAPRGLCLQQTYAPFTTVGWTIPTLLTRVDGLVLHVRLRSHESAPVPPPTTPLVVGLAGNERVGLRVSAGTVLPCTSELDVPLFSGTLDPGKALTFPTDAVCVCVQQTFAPFVTAGWTNGLIQCRPQRCIWNGVHGKICRVDPTMPFNIAVASRAD